MEAVSKVTEKRQQLMLEPDKGLEDNMTNCISLKVKLLTYFTNTDVLQLMTALHSMFMEQTLKVNY